jgi:hypothetical protein
MPLLRKANTVPKRIDLDDEGSYIEVAQEITKGDFNRLVEVMPVTDDENATISPVEGIRLMSDFFAVFVKGWSLDAPVSIEEYLNLPKDAGDAIDTKLMEHFASLNPSEPERKKSAR